MTEEASFVPYVHIYRIVSNGLPVSIVMCVQIFLQFAESHFSRVGLVEPCIINGIVLHEDVNQADTDGNVTSYDGVVFKMALALDAVVHALEFFLFQCYEISIVPVLVLVQQTFIGMYGAFSLYLLLRFVISCFLKNAPTCRQVGRS